MEDPVTYCDSHLHIANCMQFLGDSAIFDSFDNYIFATSAHSIREWEYQKNFCCAKTFGIHPQSFTQNTSDYDYDKNLIFLQKLLESGNLNAIGEAGFDLFTNEYRATIKLQITAWEMQLALAKKYKMPIVIHCRKGFDYIFKSSKILSQIPAVLFHSFFGNYIQAKSILNHGVNAYFSFGKQLLNGNKKSIDCLKNLPQDKILLETDSPYQTLKNEKFTAPLNIKKVYQAAYKIKGESIPFYEFCKKLNDNFIQLYNFSELYRPQ